MLDAFGFNYGTKQKYIHADRNSLEKMRQIIACTVNFSCVADFYTPEFIIGSGSSARVLLCKRVSNNALFAIKAINKEYLLSTENGILSFETEVSILRQLNQTKASDSQYFIKIHEVFESDITYYLITDLMQGRTLQDEIQIHRGQRKLISNKSVKTIMRRLLEGIKVMHESSIIHRDLKPQNIMFEKDGQYETLKIVDFGLATRKNVDKQYLFPKCGTPGYVAPEILNSQNKKYLYSEVCDVFSCGCIFFKLITGNNLFLAVNLDQLLRLNKKCEIDFDVDELASIDKFQFQLLKAMLVKDPLKRISASDALQFDYFTSNNIEYRASLLSQHTKKVSITSVLPLFVTKVFDVNLQEKEQKKLSGKINYSPFGNDCKTQKTSLHSRFNPRQSEPINKHKVVIDQEKSQPSSQNSMDEQQGQIPIMMRKFPNFKRPSCRSQSSGKTENYHTTTLHQKKRSLDIQLNKIKSSIKLQSWQSDTHKLSVAISNSFYMKDPLSAIVKHQQLQSPNQLRNSMDNSALSPGELNYSSHDSPIQFQELFKT